jgi:hypothetical protein
MRSLLVRIDSVMSSDLVSIHHRRRSKISAWRLKRKVHIKLVDSDNVLGGTGTDEVSAIRFLQ